MTWCFVAVALPVAVVAASLGHVTATQRQITILVDEPSRLADYGRGITLGALEADRAATLLGHAFRLVTDGPATARVAKVAPEHSDVPVVAMSGDSRTACVFLTQSPDDVRTAQQHAAARRGAEPMVNSEVSIVDWHAAFRRYGASELNERFQQTFSAPMTADAWHGWVAVKAVTEAALRGDDVCAELARLKLDGHKGRALRFDPVTRRLRHPALLVGRAGGQPIVEVVP